jgi:hypothetical protein
LIAGWGPHGRALDRRRTRAGQRAVAGTTRTLPAPDGWRRWLTAAGRTSGTQPPPGAFRDEPWRSFP